MPDTLCLFVSHRFSSVASGLLCVTTLFALGVACSSSSTSQSEAGTAGTGASSTSGANGVAGAPSGAAGAGVASGGTAVIASGGSAGNDLAVGSTSGGSTSGGSMSGGGSGAATGSAGRSSAGGSSTSGAGAGGAGAGAGGSGGGANSPFVSVCGMSLCLNGQTFRIKGATAYGFYQDPSAVVQAAEAANVNTIELVEFETKFHDLTDTMSEATWTRVDQFVAAMSAAKLHVVFNLSSYGQSLQAAGQSAVTTDWNDYLKFITTRTNTVSHVVYAQDPTIALIELFGEIPQPNGQGTNGDTQQMTDFYHRTLSELATLDPNHVRSSGGFSYLDEPNSAGIDWKTIMNDPLDQVCAVEINSEPDRDTTVPMVTSYCKGISKPWFLAAWSSCIGQALQFTGDLDSYATDDTGAAHATDMYAIATDTNVAGKAPAMAAVGTDFWNLGSGSAPTCNINSGFPKTFGVVKAAE